LISGKRPESSNPSSCRVPAYRAVLTLRNEETAFAQVEPANRPSKNQQHTVNRQNLPLNRFSRIAIMTAVLTRNAVANCGVSSTTMRGSAGQLTASPEKDRLRQRFGSRPASASGRRWLATPPNFGRVSHLTQRESAARGYLKLA
jgi:hypothetical protein